MFFFFTQMIFHAMKSEKNKIVTDGDATTSGRRFKKE